MCKSLFLTACIFAVSCQVFAQETTTETCANGAGIIITGNISQKKYCMSKTTMNWWNANAWCDALGKQLFNTNNCQRFGTGCSTNNKCLEFQNQEIGLSSACNTVWTQNVSDDQRPYIITLLPDETLYWSACIQPTTKTGSQCSASFALCPLE